MAIAERVALEASLETLFINWCENVEWERQVSMGWEPNNSMGFCRHSGMISKSMKVSQEPSLSHSGRGGGGRYSMLQVKNGSVLWCQQ